MAVAASGALYAAFAVASAWLALTDLRTRRIPNRVLGAASVGVAACGAVSVIAGAHPGRLAWAAAAAALYGVAALTLWRYAPGGSLGGGDVKLAPLVGFAAGWAGAEAAFVWTPIGIAVASMCALVWAHRRGRRTLAFGPVLLAGAWGAIFASWW